MPKGTKAVYGRFLLIAMSSAFSCAQPMDEFVQRALSSNRDYLASAQRVREAEALLRKAQVRPAPAVEVEGGASALLGSPGSQDYSVAYAQPFETGGKRSKRTDVARLAVDIARAASDDMRRRLTLEVHQRYAEALNARQRVAVLAELARANAETLRLVAARVEEGDAAPQQRLLETDVNRSELDRVMAEAKLRTALLELTRIGALAEGGPGPQLPQPVAAVPADRAELVQRAMEQRPDLRTLRATEAQASSGVILARSESSPNVSAAARYSYRSAKFDQFGFDASGALRLSRTARTCCRSEYRCRCSAHGRARQHRGGNRPRTRGTAPPGVPRGGHPHGSRCALRRWIAARTAWSVRPQGPSRRGTEPEDDPGGLARAPCYGSWMSSRNSAGYGTSGWLASDAETELITGWAALENAVGGDIQ